MAYGKSSRLMKRFGANEQGLAVTEFALIAPVFFMLLMGVFDMGHTLYMQSVLQGAIQKAARDSTLETGTDGTQQAALNDAVTRNIQSLARNATVTFSRRYFKDFTKASQANQEAFTDTNGNGTCDAGEPYQDNNNNNVWDKDGGDGGQGGAKDTVVYTAQVSYPRVFPLSKLIGLSDTTTLQAVTVLPNQPYGDQAQYGAAVQRNCP